MCGDCKDGYGVTFDLRFCRRCGAGGIVLFVSICEWTHMSLSLLMEFPFITNSSICITLQQTVHHIIPTGIVTVVVSLLILFYDLPLPDELKGFVFFAQVIGLIYRNAPYLVGQNESVSFNHTICVVKIYFTITIFPFRINFLIF